MINVWIFGYQRRPDASWPKCDCPLGQATLPNGLENNEHYLWLNYDLFDPDNMNNDQRYNAGGNVLIHEMGHYLGLEHTHGDDTNAACEGDDGVPDTPINLNAQKTPWNSKITAEVSRGMLQCLWRGYGAGRTWIAGVLHAYAHVSVQGTAVTPPASALPPAQQQSTCRRIGSTRRLPALLSALGSCRPC